MIDINATLSPLMPPIIPVGQYKYLFTFFEPKDNNVIIKVQVEVIVKATREFRAMDFSMLNMG